MATSGTTTWKLKSYDIVKAALRKLAVLSGGSLPEEYQVDDAVEALNAMIKGFHADGMPVWKMKTYSFNTQPGKVQYTLGSPSSSSGQEGGFGALASPAPLKIVQAWRNTTDSSKNIPINIYTDYNYNLLPQSAGRGEVVNLYYQPFPQSGVINVWPAPQNSTTTIFVRYHAPFEDMNSNDDDLDFPPYWTEAIIYGLAYRLAPEYGIPTADRQTLAAEAGAFKQQALSFGTEEGSLYLMPDWAGSY